MSFLGGIGDFVGDIGSSIIGGVTDAVGGIPGMLVETGLQTLAGMYTAEQAQGMSMEDYARRYQLTTQDMLKAGLNPILAASGGFSVGNSPTMHAPSISPNLSAGANTAKAFAEAEVANANVEKIRNEAEESLSRTYLNRAQTGKVTVEEKKLYNDIKVGQQNILKMQREMQRLLAAGSRDYAEADLCQWQIKKLKAELVQLQRISDVYESDAGKYMTWVNEVLRMLNLNFGGTASVVRH